MQGDASMHSLEQPVGVEKGNKTLEDMLEDTGPSMNELVVHGGLISDVNNLLHTLTPREQGVLRLRYGLDGQGERTLDDIGRFFKVPKLIQPACLYPGLVSVVVLGFFCLGCSTRNDLTQSRPAVDMS